MLTRLRKELSMTALAVEFPRVLTRIPLDAMATVTGRCKRTCRNWIDGITTPSAPDLILLMKNFEEVTDDVLRLSDRQPQGLTHEQRRKVQEALEALGD